MCFHSIFSVPPPPKINANLISKLTAEPEGYAECYPGLQEMNDAIDDSDDEVDYTKMDLGNKKGPIGRWDFDTQEEYSDYMSTKEAYRNPPFNMALRCKTGEKHERKKLRKMKRPNWIVNGKRFKILFISANIKTAVAKIKRQ